MKDQSITLRIVPGENSLSRESIRKFMALAKAEHMTPEEYLEHLIARRVEEDLGSLPIDPTLSTSNRRED